mmetsp:Transcript_15345/g.23634  ORF Transcript_15345/g.23634 Transcript_15345/m.23634 type:complete len:234 (+) Transcript_15345:3-704(+)
MIKILLLLATLAVTLAADKKGEKYLEKLGQQRLMDMQALEHKSEVDNIIIFEDIQTYQNLVLQYENRPYHVVVLFNLKPEEQQERCEHCMITEQQFSQLAYSFVQDRSAKHETEQKPVFFVIFHLDSDEKISLFTGFHGHTTIPILSVSAADEHHGEHDFSHVRFFTTDNEWEIIPGDIVTGLKQIEFVNNALRTDVQLKLTLKQMLKANLMITGILGGLVCLVVFGYPLLMI